MLYLFINLIFSAFTDSIHDHHGITNYQIMDCSEQKIDMIGNNFYQIYFSAFNISYTVCLNSVPDYVSPQVYNMMDKNIKHLSGSLCGFPESGVNGFIDNNCFYGSIIYNNSHLSIEIPDNSDNNYKNKVLVYRNVDIKQRLKLTDKPLHSTKPRINDTLKLGDVNMENKYCGIIIDMHKSFISLYANMNAAISSAISAIHFLNRAITSMNIEESQQIKFYLKGINIINRLPILNDVEIIDMFKLHEKYNELLEKGNRSSCISSLFIGINGNGTIGLAYIGNSYGYGICDKSTSGNIITKSYDFTISDLDFWQLFAHEIGHQLGSEHDPEDPCTEVSKECPGGVNDTECVGDDEIGRFIMFPYIQELEDLDHRMFSECSIKYIKKLINLPGRRRCFEAAAIGFDNTTLYEKCGNGIIDLFEECDAGTNGDQCCTNECVLTNGSECSDFNGKCCKNCTLLAKGFICSKSSKCSFKSVCDGISPICRPKFKKNIQCNYQQGICSNGVCNRDICHYYNLQKCEILQEDLLCKVSCHGNNNDCTPIKLRKRYFHKPKNTPCNNGAGRCSNNGTCIYRVPPPLSEVIAEERNFDYYKFR